MNSITRISKQCSNLLPQAAKQLTCYSTTAASASSGSEFDSGKITFSERFIEFQRKLLANSPLGKPNKYSTSQYREVDPFKPWPNSVNPFTGEIGGPTGPEPTRYGDWERKGRVSDF